MPFFLNRPPDCLCTVSHWGHTLLEMSFSTLYAFHTTNWALKYLCTRKFEFDGLAYLFLDQAVITDCIINNIAHITIWQHDVSLVPRGLKPQTDWIYPPHGVGVNTLYGSTSFNDKSSVICINSDESAELTIAVNIFETNKNQSHGLRPTAWH